MKNKIFMIISVVIIICSCIFGALTDVGNDIPALVGTAFGLGMEIIAVRSKSEKKNWMVDAAIVCAVIGGLCCCFAGISEKTTSSLVVAAIGLVTLILSIFAGIFAAKKE